MSFGLGLGLASTALQSVIPVAAQVIPFIFPQVRMAMIAMTAIQVVAPIVGKLIEKYLDKKMDIAEAGDRVLQAKEAGIVPDKFEKFSDYEKEISNFKLDPIKSETYTPEDKLQTGVAFASTLLAEAKNTTVDNVQNALGLIEKNPDYFNADRIDNMLDKSIDMGSVDKYVSNELSMSKSIDVGSLLVQAEKALFPDKPETQIKQELSQLSFNK